MALVEPGPDATAGSILVDAVGKACPIPVIELAAAMREASIGDRVRLLADDAAAKVDVPVWCRMQRQLLVAQGERADGVLVFDVDKAAELR